MDANIAFAREHGYVKTVMNRKRWLKDINSRNSVVRGHAERNAINTPIQGSAADIIKVAMVDIHNKLEQMDLKSKLLLQVHDELVFDALKEELNILKPLVKKAMEGAYSSSIPLVVDLGEGLNWLEAH
jgi:DNA polymerase-1